MYPHQEKYTERVKRIMDLSAKAAMGLEAEFIGTEHLFLGLIQEGEGLGGKVLKNLRITEERVVKEIKNLSPSISKNCMPSQLTPTARKTLDMAYEVSIQLGHDVIGTEHILLALLKLDSNSTFINILTNLGLVAAEVRDLVLECLGVDAEPSKSKHFVSASCNGERCRICKLPATHKLGEEIPHDDPLPARHNLTAYICCAHFIEIVGFVHTGPCRGEE